MRVRCLQETCMNISLIFCTLSQRFYNSICSLWMSHLIMHLAFYLKIKDYAYTRVYTSSRHPPDNNQVEFILARCAASNSISSRMGFCFSLIVKVNCCPIAIVTFFPFLWNNITLLPALLEFRVSSWVGIFR